MQLDGDFIELMEGGKKLKIPPGAYSDCPVEPEQDGWEMPVYMVSVCPDCGEVICL